MVRTRGGKTTTPRRSPARRSRSPARRRSPTRSPSTSLVAGAVLGEVGSQTAQSLVSGRRSRQLQAGMDTMVSLTRRELRKTKDCKAGCPNPKRPVQDKATCKCYSANSDVLRKKGICAPVMKQGRVVERVAVPVIRVAKGQRVQTMQCVLAGKRAAKKKLGEAGCPSGKFLKRYPDGSSRCVKATASNGKKDCAANLVLAEQRLSGTTFGKSWTKSVVRCVSAKTAARGGKNGPYRVIRQGTLPVKPYRLGGKAASRKAASRSPTRRTRSTRRRSVAMSPGVSASPTGWRFM